MKEVKTIIIATIITCLIIISTAFALPAQAESRPEFYPRLTVVVNSTRIESHTWVVECQDKEGNRWAFFDDVGTWSRGDIANLLMWAITDKEEEDEIVEVYWEGYTENIESYFRLMGWRQ